MGGEQFHPDNRRGPYHGSKHETASEVGGVILAIIAIFIIGGLIQQIL